MKTANAVREFSGGRLLARINAAGTISPNWLMGEDAKPVRNRICHSPARSHSRHQKLPRRSWQNFAWLPRAGSVFNYLPLCIDYMQYSPTGKRCRASKSLRVLPDFMIYVICRNGTNTTISP
jgi:hypothetical protein